MYADGQAGSINKPIAYAWLTKAVENNFPQAANALSSLADDMSISEISKAKTEIMELDAQITSSAVVSPTKDGTEPLAEKVVPKVGAVSSSFVPQIGGVNFTAGAPVSAPLSGNRTKRSRRMIRRR